MSPDEFVREIRPVLKEAKQHIEAVDRMSDECWTRIRQIGDLLDLCDPSRRAFNSATNDFHFAENGAQQSYLSIRRLVKQAAGKFIHGEEIGGWIDTAQGELYPIEEARKRARTAMHMVDVTADALVYEREKKAS